MTSYDGWKTTDPQDSLLSDEELDRGPTEGEEVCQACQGCFRYRVGQPLESRQLCPACRSDSEMGP